MVRNTHLMLTALDGSGAVHSAGLTVDDFPDEVRLQVEVLMADGSRESNVVTIPLKITDAMGIPPVKRLFLPPSAEEMLEAHTKLGDLERRLEEDD